MRLDMDVFSQGLTTFYGSISFSFASNNDNFNNKFVILEEQI